MFYKLIPFLFTIVGAKPLYVGSPPMLGQGFSGLNLHHLAQSSGLVSQPLDFLYKLGSLEQLGQLSRSLVSSHLGGLGLPLTSLAFASQSPLSFALSPEKSIAGALIKQVPKLSKHPIAVSFSPKSLELKEQFGSLGGLSGVPPLSSVPGLSGKSFLNDFGLSFEY